MVVGMFCALANHLAAVGDERLGVLEQQRVLASAGQRDVAGQLPHAAAVALVHVALGFSSTYIASVMPLSWPERFLL